MTDDIVTRFIELLTQVAPSLSESLALEIEYQIRQEFAGERIYIAKRDEAIASRIAEKFNGRNVRELAREMHVSRRTIYRAIKKTRKSRAMQDEK